jgi:hypothetical protein
MNETGEYHIKQNKTQKNKYHFFLSYVKTFKKDLKVEEGL